MAWLFGHDFTLRLEGLVPDSYASPLRGPSKVPQSFPSLSAKSN